jgi:hypothetical protein
MLVMHPFQDFTFVHLLFSRSPNYLCLRHAYHLEPLARQFVFVAAAAAAAATAARPLAAAMSKALVFCLLVLFLQQQSTAIIDN